jgi:multiple antibiotic resistance protein
VPGLIPFLQSTAAILAITNPLAAIPVFLALAPPDDALARRRAARRVAIAVLSILAAAAVVGRYLLLLFGISFAAFRAGGGLVITLMGLDMLRGNPTPVQRDPAAADADDRLLVPLAMPLLAGPGSITTVMTLTVREPALAQLPSVLLAVTCTAAAVWLTLSLAGALRTRIGDRGQAIILRFMGLVLVAVGAQLGLTGIAEFFAARG